MPLRRIAKDALEFGRDDDDAANARGETTAKKTFYPPEVLSED